MKKVREVLEMKSKQERLSFVEKFEFWRVEVAECKKTMFLKTNFSSPLKMSFFFIFFFFCISQVSDLWTNHESTHEMCRCTGQNFACQVWVANYSRGSRKTLYLKFLRYWNSLKISRLGTTCKSSLKMAKHSFSTQRIWQFEKKFQHQSDKNHFQKQIKY